MRLRTRRILWGLVGACLAVGVITSLLLLLGPPDRPWQAMVRELGVLVDVLALVFWLLIFTIPLWRRRR